jgi:xanthine dehydrogenase accessory factor
MKPLWSRLLAVIDAPSRAALVTVVSAEGSTPREAGARMIVRPDGGFFGTVGGGALEWELIADARRLIASGGPARLVDTPLGPALGQCCGGRVTALIEVFGPDDRDHVAALAEAEEGEGGFGTEAPWPVEGARLARVPKPSRFETTPAEPLRHEAFGGPTGSPIDLVPHGEEPAAGGHLEPSWPDRNLAVTLRPDRIVENFRNDRTRLVLFGAGHVGRALVTALAPLPFRIRWVDDRPDAFPRRVPSNVEAVAPADPVAEVGRLPAGAFVLVMTHSHPLDLAVTAAALARGDLGFVGLIGSGTKRARFEKRMNDAGLTAEAVRSLVCPIGIAGITGKEPAVIAAATVAQLLAERERIAAARRAETEQRERA